MRASPSGPWMMVSAATQSAQIAARPVRAAHATISACHGYRDDGRSVWSTVTPTAGAFARFAARNSAYALMPAARPSRPRVPHPSTVRVRCPALRARGPLSRGDSCRTLAVYCLTSRRGVSIVRHMDTTTAARSFYDNMQALRAGNVTVEQARAANRSLRQAIGDDAYDAAKVAALSFDIRQN
jgi:hypothetical protein